MIFILKYSSNNLWDKNIKKGFKYTKNVIGPTINFLLSNFVQNK